MRWLSREPWFIGRRRGGVGPSPSSGRRTGGAVARPTYEKWKYLTWNFHLPWMAIPIFASEEAWQPVSPPASCRIF
jgi:hypothetical protein